MEPEVEAILREINQSCWTDRLHRAVARSG